MNQIKKIKDNILAAIKSLEVATAAEVTLTEWSQHHVFDGGREMIGGMNRGRVPYVLLFRNNTEYNIESVGAAASDLGGTLKTTWTIRVVAGRNKESTAEEVVSKISSVILYKIRNDERLEQGEENLGEIQSHPYGCYADISIICDNTWSQDRRAS